MGKGDIRTRRGKLYRGTYGNSRSRDTNNPKRGPTPASPGVKPKGGKEAA